MIKVAAPKAGVVVGLLLLCLIPRIWAGTLHDVLCPDAVSYIRWTEALESGNARVAFQYTGVCLYQPLLLGLKSLPGDWLTLAKWWSVAMATLAILPIYGWIRRQFNETLAIIGGGFYALHPAVIHDSPLIVRDPTFWLLFALGLYTAWRSVSELRYRWFAAFAVVFGLAIHLRTEGWLLAPVLVVWITFRPQQTWGNRFVTALAASLAVAVGPVGGWVVHEMMFAPVEKRVQTSMHKETAKEEAEKTVKSGIVGDKRHLARIEALGEDAVSTAMIMDGTVKSVVRYGKGFGILQLVLAMAGMAHWRLRSFGPSKGALLLLVILSAGAIWACFCLIGLDRRYVVPSVIVSLPAIAAGLCLTASLVARRSTGTHRQEYPFWLYRLLAASGIFLAAVVLASPRPLLRDQAEIGRWIRANLGPGVRIAMNLKWPSLVEYYSEGTILFLVPPSGPRNPEKDWLALCKSKPSVLLIWLEWPNLEGREPFELGISMVKGAGYREVPADELPEECRRILVLVREDRESARLSARSDSSR